MISVNHQVIFRTRAKMRGASTAEDSATQRMNKLLLYQLHTTHNRHTVLEMTSKIKVGRNRV